LSRILSARMAALPGMPLRLRISFERSRPFSVGMLIAGVREAMRSDQEMLDLILAIARDDERIRAVIMNGSHANPEAPRDFFQDFDIVYVVEDMDSFKQTPGWIERFGKLMILQLPDDMGDHPEHGDRYAYLMQFADGNRIDLTLYPVEKVDQLARDSLSVLLLDKDGIIKPFPPSNESDYLAEPPTPKTFADCCNEFWWICPYVAKGLWREEITYATGTLNQYLRPELMKMLIWYAGIEAHFSFNPGKFGRNLKRYLDPELWGLLLASYSDADIENTWDALEAACRLFRTAARSVAGHFGYAYPHHDDENVTAHLQHVRRLPKDAQEMYAGNRNPGS
jgi:aminoglycoside 6-adenylyltransferase